MPKKKEMAWNNRQKYNWDKIKLDFFSSEIMEVKAFAEWKFGKYTGTMKTRMLGWSKEKQEFINKAKEQAKSELQEKMKELYKPSEEELAKMHEAVMWVFKAKVFSNAQKITKLDDWTIIIPPDIDIKENKMIWEVLKTEQGMPTRVNENQLTWKGWEKLIWKITIE